MPAGELGSPHGRLTGRARRAGPRRGYRVPHARAATGVGALYTPGTAVLIPAEGRARPAPAALPAASPAPRSNIPSRGDPLHEASTRVYAIHPSGLPLACSRPDGTGALGLPPEASHPADRRRRTSGRGQAVEHGPGTTRSHQLILQSGSSLVSCDLASHRAKRKRGRRLHSRRRHGPVPMQGRAPTSAALLALVRRERLAAVAADERSEANCSLARHTLAASRLAVRNDLASRWSAGDQRAGRAGRRLSHPRGAGGDHTGLASAKDSERAQEI